MTVQLVLGSSGSGKTQWLYQNLLTEAKEQESLHYLVVVPEQFTMQTQRDFVMLSKEHSILNIDILSFMRLAYRIFEETGEEDRVVLEDTGKMMLLRKIAEEKKEELPLLGGQLKKPGFLDEVKSFLSELYQYGMTLEDWRKLEKSCAEKRRLSAKLSDIGVVWEAFGEKIKGQFRVAEEIMAILSQKLCESEWIRNSVICLDGFTGFTPVQYAVLSELMGLCKKMYVTVTIDSRQSFLKREEESNLFHLSAKTIRKFYEMAREKRAEVLPPVYPGEYFKKENGRRSLPRFKDSPALSHLEANLFRFPYKPYPEEQEDIRVIRTKDRMDEVLCTVSEIKRLVQEEKYRYREIGVVTGDISLYGNLIKEAYQKAQIPFFLDQKAQVSKNPAVDFILSWLLVLEQDFSFDALFRFLKNEFSFLKGEDRDRLENYSLAMGFRHHSQWKKPFARNYRHGRKEDLEKMNELREQVLLHIGTDYEAAGSLQTVREYSELLHGFLVREEVYKKIREQGALFEQAGEALLVKEYEQVYGMVLELLDRMVELLGNEKISISEYREILEEGFLKAEVGLIPQGLDKVVAGDIERTRLKDIKALFFLGVNDGIIPKANQGGGILSDLDREFIKEQEFALAPTKRERMFQGQFYLYLNLTKPKNKLYVSFSSIGADGKRLSPSYLIGKIEKLFPMLSIEEWNTEKRTKEDWYQILALDRGREYLLGGIRGFMEGKTGRETTTREDPNENPFFRALFLKYREEEEFQAFMEKIAAGYLWNGQEGISKRAAKLLYGNYPVSSITRLEQYAACAFSHYLMYGMDLKEREIQKISVPDLGTLFHAAMEKFSRHMKEDGLLWNQIGEGEQEILVKRSVSEVLEEFHLADFYAGSREAYLEKRILRMVKRTVWAVCEQLKKGEFQPERFEVGFQMEAGIRVRGKIDRIDTAVEKDTCYLKVIDYKSGKTRFDLEKIYQGLSLQLVVYLEAAKQEIGKENPGKLVIPAGIYYYGMDDPMLLLDAKRMEEPEIQKELLKKLKLSGLTNSDMELLKKLDQDFSGEYPVKSAVIPVYITKNGGFGRYSEVADTRQFYALGQHIKKKIEQYGKEIEDGNASIKPYRFHGRTGCDYCPYGEICGFGAEREKRYREIAPFSDKNEIWEKLREECPEDGGEDTGQ